MSTLKATIFIAVIGFVFTCTSCQKEYSYEGANPPGAVSTANFVLEGAPNSCFDFVLNGTYNRGNALTVDNSVLVMVNVTTIGSYSVKTNTVDGFGFSRSGTFTSTGSQELLLPGTGTPETAGTYAFTPNSGSSSCSFAVNVKNTQPPATYQFASNSDGTCSSYQTPSAIYHGVPLTSGNSMTVTVNVNAVGNFNISTNTINGITFSQSGYFSSLGAQKIRLSGRGTPVEPGVFVFTPYIIVDGSRVGNGCNIDVYVF